MATYHSAFGLNLCGDVALPGLSAGATATLPELRLEPAAPDALGRLWSGSAVPGSWQGTLRDGVGLTIRRGRAGDLLFEYGSAAGFLLDADAERLYCAAVAPDSLAWRRVLLSRVLPVVAIARGHEALHAAAVRTREGVVALVGAGGAGKSTSAAELVRQGHGLVADDVLAVGRVVGRAVAFPSGPHLCLEPGGEGGLEVEVLGELGGKLWTVVEGAAQDPAPVAAIVLLERGAGPVAIEELPTSPLPLTPFMLGVPDDDARDAARFSLYADLVESARLFRLRGGAGVAPSAVAAVLARTVGAPAMAAAGEGR